MRVTEKQVQSVFTRCLNAHDFTQGAYLPANDRTPDRYTRDGYFLDYNPTYGGYLICEFRNGSTGSYTPFGTTRHSGSDMLAMLHFSMDTQYVKEHTR